MPHQQGFKIAFAATTRVGNAVVRNYYRRRLREFYRTNKMRFPKDGEMFLLVRNPVADWPDFFARLTELLKTL